MKDLSFWAASLVFATLIVLLFISNFYSPILIGPSVAKLSNDFLPQGWAFFTKSPRDQRTEVYLLDTKENLIKPNFSAEYYFGLSRIPRRIGLEVGRAVSDIPDSHWFMAQSNTDVFLPSTMLTQKTSDLKKPLLQGHIAIANRDRLPWAYRKYSESASLKLFYTQLTLYSK